MSILRGHKLPKSSKILLGLLTSISGLLLVLKYESYRSLLAATNEPIKFHDVRIPFIQLIPRSTIFNPWVLVLAIFAEISIFTFILSATILYVGSKFTERFWGYLEVIKFILIIGTITNLFTIVLAIISNIIREDAKNMDQPLGGGISYYFAFLVVFKQLIPEHNIVLFQGLVNFRVKHVPFALLIIFTLWSIFISKSMYPAVPSIGSFFVSFFYLRFFQSLSTEPNLPLSSNDASNSSVITGDASDTFQLIEFFPNVTKPILTPVFNQVYEVSVLLGIITPFNDESVEQSNLRAQKRQEQVNQNHKNVANSVAERRRQVALQVIEDRINKETAAAAAAAASSENSK
ncbi:MAG: rhomboid family protein [Asgard group archaeon]|nr:rhomboid family protein [Asgard group archaeon]